MMDEYSKNDMEYTVEKKPEGLLKVKRTLLVIGYVIFSLAYFLIFIKTFFPLLAILPLLMIWIVVPKTWRYVSIENEIMLVSGTLSYTIVYGKKKRHKVMETKIKGMEIIAPMTDEYKEKYQNPSFKKVYDARSANDSPDSYFAIFKNESGGTECLYFDASNKMIQIMKFYNGISTVPCTTLRH